MDAITKFTEVILIQLGEWLEILLFSLPTIGLINDLSSSAYSTSHYYIIIIILINQLAYKFDYGPFHNIYLD